MWCSMFGEALERNHRSEMAKARGGWDREVNKQSLLGHID